MSGRLIITGKKSYCPWRPENVERVLRDERLERERLEREGARQEATASLARIDALRAEGRKRRRGKDAEESSDGRRGAEGGCDAGGARPHAAVGHVNLFEDDERRVSEGALPGVGRRQRGENRGKKPGVMPVYLGGDEVARRRAGDEPFYLRSASAADSSADALVGKDVVTQQDRRRLREDARKDGMDPMRSFVCTGAKSTMTSMWNGAVRTATEAAGIGVPRTSGTLGKAKDDDCGSAEASRQGKDEDTGPRRLWPKRRRREERHSSNRSDGSSSDGISSSSNASQYSSSSGSVEQKRTRRRRKRKEFRRRRRHSRSDDTNDDSASGRSRSSENEITSSCEERGCRERCSRRRSRHCGGRHRHSRESRRTRSEFSRPGKKHVTRQGDCNNDDDEGRTVQQRRRGGRPDVDDFFEEMRRRRAEREAREALRETELRRHEADRRSVHGDRDRRYQDQYHPGLSRW